MILVDHRAICRPDPQDGEHERCKAVLEGIEGALVTTTPVLTAAFHLLTPDSIGADRLRDFILGRGVTYVVYG
jgi:hypothetical protein